jgi:hypothetical protein
MSKQHYEVAAYYFPNWHRRPWDEGDDFGEWPVLKVAPVRFSGHAQPKVPQWGYEDESDPKMMAKKIDAAADHGVSVFLFDWYFNDNGTFLEDALNKGYLKAKNHSRLKFALMWANHELKGEHIHGKGAIDRPTFDKLVAHAVKNFMTHPAYWRLDGKPYFSIYEIDNFINGFGGVEGARAALDHFRKSAKAAGLKGVHVNIVDWQLAYRNDIPTVLKTLAVDSVTPYVWGHLIQMKDFPETDYRYMQEEYFKHCEKAASTYGVPYYPNVTVGWDSTPRIDPGQPHANKGYPDTPVLKDSTPANFKRALEQAKAFLDKQPAAQRILTIYAWNEWTEGGYLEPDTIHKFAHLEAIQEVFS